MSTTTIAELSAQVRTLEPAARLIERRWLRRIIRRHLGMSASASAAPHEIAYWISRSELQGLVDLAELGWQPDEPLPERILLLPIPDEVSGDLRRALFHARLDAALDEPLATGSFDATIRDIFKKLGPTTRHELEVVLREEGLLFEPETERDLFREFAAYFLELRYCRPQAVEQFLPGIAHPEEFAEALRPFVDAQAVFDAITLPDTVAADAQAHAVAPKTPVVVDRESARKIAANAAQVGNDARAAIESFKCGDMADGQAHVDKLADRLKRALHLPDADTWRSLLRELASASSDSRWPVSARLLHDLQAACVDTERPLYAVDLVEWIVSVGTQPVKRRLEKPREVNVLRHLRSAVRHAERLPDSVAHREEIETSLNREIAATERRVRADMRPVLLGVLDEVGLVPANMPEKLSREKLVEELLDRICERGFIRMGDLRDAIARNRLKLPDLAGPLEWLRGDPLLRANRLLAVRLDGVYRRGEVYMRALQRFSSLAFGTRVGRFLTKYLALPFGGAFVILEGAHHIAEAAVGGWHFAMGHKSVTKAVDLPPGHAHGELSATWTSVGLLGVLLLALLYWPAFRHQVGKALRVVLLDVPAAIATSPALHFLFNNRATRFFKHYLLVPLLTGGLTALALLVWNADLLTTLLGGGFVAFITGVFFRTSMGRDYEERVNEVLAHGWRFVTANVIVGALTLVIDVFRALLEWFERLLYAVDERLRFREGDSRLSFAFKLVIGFLWFLVTYLLRFGINVLLEPQINPVKHFPVVTVSHKLLLPLIPTLSDAFNVAPERMFVIVSAIPGLFGFLVWELKENWKLYRANRSPTLDPVPVGSHGEKVRGLLRPGFHSGVVPKTFAKYRKALRVGNHSKAHKHEHSLHHVAEAIDRLIERELLAYLRQSERWENLTIERCDIALSPHRIRIRLTLQNAANVVVIAIEERAGWLFGSIEEPGWLNDIPAGARAAFADVLAGLYALAGIHIAREQAAALFGPQAYSCDALPDALLVPTADGPSISYVWSDEAELRSESDIGQKIAKTDLVYSADRLTWRAWVERWEQDHDGKAPRDTITPMRLLP